MKEPNSALLKQAVTYMNTKALNISKIATIFNTNSSTIILNKTYN